MYKNRKYRFNFSIQIWEKIPHAVIYSYMGAVSADNVCDFGVSIEKRIYERTFFSLCIDFRLNRRQQGIQGFGKCTNRKWYQKNRHGADVVDFREEEGVFCNNIMVRGIASDHEQPENMDEIFYNQRLSVSDLVIKVFLEKSGS